MYVYIIYIFLGLYLYILVVETFTRENIKLRVYMFIGWGKCLFLMFSLNTSTLNFKYYYELSLNAYCESF